MSNMYIYKYTYIHTYIIYIYIYIYIYIFSYIFIYIYVFVFCIYIYFIYKYIQYMPCIHFWEWNSFDTVFKYIDPQFFIGIFKYVLLIYFVTTFFFSNDCRVKFCLMLYDIFKYNDEASLKNSEIFISGK